MEEYFFDLQEEEHSDSVFVLIIYDIVENKKRVQLAKYLQGFGFRIQKSAFEAIIPKKKYRKLLEGIPQFVGTDDSVKVYKIIGKGQVKTFGKIIESEQEEIIII